MAKLHFSGTDFAVYSEDLDPQLLSDLLDCSGPGAADAAVAYVIQHHDISGDAEQCKAYLRGYGAWDDDELADHNENLSRLVWLTGCALAETGEAGEMPGAYFSAY